MVTHLKNRLIALTLLLALVESESANAQSFTSSTITGVLQTGFLNNLITAGIAMWTLVEFQKRYTQILEGSDVVKHLIVLGGLVGLTIWWPGIVQWVLGTAK